MKEFVNIMMVGYAKALIPICWSNKVDREKHEQLQKKISYSLH